MTTTVPHTGIKSIPPCPERDRHSWIMSAANICRINGISATEAELIITERLNRPPAPRNEVETAVKKAYQQSDYRSHSNIRGQWKKPPVRLIDIKFDEQKLRATSYKITHPENWRHWLWERSPKRPEAMNSFSFLAHVFRPGEKVQVFDVFAAKRPFQTVSITSPMDCRVSEALRAGGSHGSGIWYLCNPVDGQWHDTGVKDDAGEPELSCRNYQAVTSWRHAVLESDAAAPDLWLGFVAQLPIKTIAIYTSGGKSIHCLFRVDAPTKEAWDQLIARLKRPAKVMGADAGCLSAVRLTRLPQCWRPEKNNFQRLLYLNPDPPECPLVDMPVLFSRPWTLARWRKLCPRWSREEAEQ